MITPTVAAAMLAVLPAGSARYRAELSGETVGVADLRIACSSTICEVTYASRLRAPVEAGGALQTVRVKVKVDSSGRYRGGELRMARGAERSAPPGVQDAVPSALVEVVLGAVPDGKELCIPFFREGSAAGATACGRRVGGTVLARVGGVRERIVPANDGFPAEVLVLDRFRFLRDAAAAVPARAPRIAGTRVAGPADPAVASEFCGSPADPPASRTAMLADLPPPQAPGESCREKTEAWLAAARARGIDGRTAVGVAWDGSGFVWHAWAEVRLGDTWVPVDPSFRELPARGPRFTLGRFAEGDEPAREAAGARILACWGSARVTGLSAPVRPRRRAG